VQGAPQCSICVYVTCYKSGALHVDAIYMCHGVSLKAGDMYVYRSPLTSVEVVERVVAVQP
jgi:predicted 2-oxoglutarate/Fe(II)-dependent dioxygenase YbiX